MIRVLIAAAVSAAAAAPAAAQFQKPEDAVKYRKAAFTVMNAHFARIGAMVQGRAPYDPAAAAANAELVSLMAPLPFAAFPDGTSGTEKGQPKPVVWTQRAKFDLAAKAMQEQVSELSVVAKRGNLDQLKSAFGDAAKTCKACHDDYRQQ